MIQEGFVKMISLQIRLSTHIQLITATETLTERKDVQLFSDFPSQCGPSLSCADHSRGTSVCIQGEPMMSI